MSASSLPRAGVIAPRVNSGVVSRPKRLLVKVSFFALLLLLWQLFVMTRYVPVYLFPGPVEVYGSFIDMAKSGQLFNSIRLSLSRMGIGYSISVIGGLIIGVIAARNWLFKETFGTLIMSLQSLPSVCWLPFALLWVGLNEGAILTVIILGAMFSIAIATEGAIRNVAPIYLKVGRVLGARGPVFARDILLFAALPELIGGLKLGWTFAWRSLMAAELIRQDAFGVGRMLETGRNYTDVSLMMASMVIILAIGLFVDSVLFGNLERKVRRRYGLEKPA